MAAEWDRIDPEELVRLQGRRLLDQVRHQLYPHSAFYRGVLEEAGVGASGFGGTDAIARLPLTGRETLAAEPKDFVLTPSTESLQRWGAGKQIADVFMAHVLGGIEAAGRRLRAEYAPVHALETSGTTGEPIQIRLTLRDLALLATQGKRMFEVAGVEPETTVVNLLHPGEPGAFWAVWLGAVAHGLDQRALGPVAPERAAEVCRAVEATTLVGRGPEVLDVLGVAGEEGLPSLTTIVLAPEVVTPLLYRRLREASGGETTIVRTYFFAEGRGPRAECAEGAGRPDAGYHTYPDLEFFEVISSRTEESVDRGRAGELVYTGLDQRGTALARYRPGDVAMGGIDRGPCRYCGRTVPRLVGPIIRAQNLLEVRGAEGESFAVDVEVVAEALSHPNVAGWQVEVGRRGSDPWDPDEVYVLFDPRGRADPAQVAIELHRSFTDEVGFEPTQLVLSDRAEGEVVDLRS